MPVLNGYEAVKRLKQMETNEEIQPTKVVAVTADVSELNKTQCSKAGFDAFLSKPINST